MDSVFDEAKREVKAALTRLGKEGLPRALGLRFRKEGQRVWVHCPWHADANPSAALSIGEEGTLRLHCYPCDRTGDALDLVAHARGLEVETDFREVVIEGLRVTGLWRLEAELCDESGLERATVRRPVKLPPPPPPEVKRSHLDPAEVSAFWNAVPRLVDYRQVGEFDHETIIPDREAYDLLARRRISPERSTDLDLARVITADTRLPRWARYQGDRPAPASWFETGHRILVPTFDRAGAMRGVRAWRVGPPRPPDDEKTKRLPPSGYPVKGLVLADPIAQAMLRDGRAPAWWPKDEPFRVLIAEGEPDHLMWSTRWPDGLERVPAVLGIPGSGAWTPEIAARVPDGARVYVRTDPDGAGDGYADLINDHLGDRCEVIRRKRQAA